MTITQGGGQANGQRQRQGVNYVQTKDLTNDPQRAKIIAVKSNVGANAAVAKILISGTPFLLGLRPNTPNLTTLLTAFGSDENDWVEKEIMLANVWDEFAERSWVTVTKAPAPEVTKEKPKR